MSRPLHITFGRFAETFLKDSFKKTNDELEVDVIALTEDLSMGPLKLLDTETGMIKRKEWLSEVGANTSNLSYLLESDSDNYERIRGILGTRDLHIWLGRDSGSYIGFLRLMHELKAYSDRVFILQCPEKIQYPIGEFPFLHIGLLNLEQIGKLHSCFQHLQFHQYLNYDKEWLEVTQHDSVLRIEDNTFAHVDEDYWDELIISRCTNDFKPSARVVGEVLYDIFDRWQTANDSYLNWRLKTLINKKVLSYEGILAEMRDYSVKLKD